MLAFYLGLIENEKEKRQFEEIYYAYRKQMFYVAKNILNDIQDAEDIVHDVFCSVASSHMHVIMNAESETDIRNYMLKSVKNACLSLRRKRNVRYRYENEIRKERIELSDDEFLSGICDKMEAETVMKAMSGMDEKYRDVLYYHFVLDLSVAETAEILGRPANTVKVQIARAKCILADQITGREK